MLRDFMGFDEGLKILEGFERDLMVIEYDVMVFDEDFKALNED